MHHECRYIIQTDIDFFYGQVNYLTSCSFLPSFEQPAQRDLVPNRAGRTAREPLLGTEAFRDSAKVTCNYLARAKGVGKLQLITDALKCCPELVIVNGEDLDRYRAASKKVFHLARSLVWGEKVERLGMDELFMDVTDMVVAHMADLDRPSPSSSMVPEHDNDLFFNLSLPGLLPAGFHYKRDTWAGHLISLSGDHLFDLTSPASPPASDSALQALYAASHLAAHIRGMIRSTLSFTCSAGVATSKLMAKLAADTHKPDAQTLLVPEAGESFIGPVPIKKIMGIGLKTMKILCERLREDREETGVGMEDGNGREEEDEEKLMMKQGDGPDAWMNNKMTVAFVKARTSREKFEDWFGQKAGGHMWELLNGEDYAEVIPTPTIPTQISIEDSFQHCTTLSDAGVRLVSLATDLIRRLETDLVDPATGAWARYPRTVRLTTRARSRGSEWAWKERRESRSAPMPVEVFEKGEIEERAKKVTEASLLPLLRKLVKEPFDVTLFNIAAVQLSTEKPASSITGFFSSALTQSPQRKPPPQPLLSARDWQSPASSSSSSSQIDSVTPRNVSHYLPSPPPDVDPSVWHDLPYEIQVEIATHYRVEVVAEGLDGDGVGTRVGNGVGRAVGVRKRGDDDETKDLDEDGVGARVEDGVDRAVGATKRGDDGEAAEGDEDRSKRQKRDELATLEYDREGEWEGLDDLDIVNDEWDVDGKDKGNDPGSGDYVCPQCGSHMFAWCRDAHEVFHRQREG
ncbi:hypothetical protein BC936DRAFT_137102 [Jimgerdemannia flammicorona]|uniref:UmuC domain-containing protein n=1 Tax=Jimgerdemannia flammicorona TaxID=994334 RepID=A0A433CY33_9FUNG|nr:hypothetical protein BC936DRAFT_137102 [Jimgerdemannia flammicorona]